MSTTSSINRGRPKFSNLNCGEMVCNDVKYCPEKDADSYYGQAGTEPFNLKLPASAPAGENADPSVPLPICYGVAREYSRVHFFHFFFRVFLCLTSSLPATTSRIFIHDFFRVRVIPQKPMNKTLSIKFQSLFSYNLLFFICITFLIF